MCLFASLLTACLYIPVRQPPGGKSDAVGTTELLLSGRHTPVSYNWHRNVCSELSFNFPAAQPLQAVSLLSGAAAQLILCLRDFPLLGLGHWGRCQHHPFGNHHLPGSTPSPSVGRESFSETKRSSAPTQNTSEKTLRSAALLMSLRNKKTRNTEYTCNRKSQINDFI